jgi:hypothetical protein
VKPFYSGILTVCFAIYMQVFEHKFHVDTTLFGPKQLDLEGNIDLTA